MLKVNGRIIYEIKPTHPDIKCIPGWYPGKMFVFEDTYTFHNTDNIDEATLYVMRDLAIVASGGYNGKHIDNVQYVIKEVK